MNIERLVEFQVLAQVLHFSNAAEMLYISQSVLSRHIQDLEAELNVKLFERNPHGVTLTNAGETLYRLTGELLDLNEMANNEIRTLSLNVTGSVHFACLRSSMSDKIEDFIGRFDQKHPDVSLSPVVIDSQTPENLSTSHCLVTSSKTLYLSNSYKLRHVLHEKCWLILPRKHEKIYEEEVSARILDGETIFIPGKKIPSGSFARIAKEIERITSGRAKIIRVSTPETALINANLGRGFTILPRHRIDERNRHIKHVALKEDFSFDSFLYHNTDFNEPASDVFENEFINWMESD